MQTESTFTDIAKERFVSLTTFRKSGEPVSTPVWIGLDGHTLIVTTPADSGKVKRLRNNPRVEMRPCDRRGKVKPGAEPVVGVADILTNPDGQRRLEDIIRRKYRLEYRIFMLIERIVRRGKVERVILRITQD